MSESKEPPVKRSLSLSKKTNEDLLALADELGVNPHSYMVNELAKAIQRDSIAFQMKKNTDDKVDTLMQLLQSSFED